MRENFEANLNQELFNQKAIESGIEVNGQVEVGKEAVRSGLDQYGLDKAGDIGLGSGDKFAPYFENVPGGEKVVEAAVSAAPLIGAAAVAAVAFAALHKTYRYAKSPRKAGK
jgi:hypothetical protein